ncbi:hypothetical protein RI844_06975 [Thalassotalea fonticola]|uniref:Outer membrane beta-barrel domain-containing protein n=1 Tax=Thalassotalea fonticola TaxID=3065649 RepID=A0ABZ0GT12_9GAMM|nr:hypothetical protein RI844_06975 [Colwelliaceae bacterium S1-1]
MVNVKRNVCLLAGLLAIGSFAQAEEIEESGIIEPVISRQAVDVDIHASDWEIGVFAGAANMDQGTTNAVAGARFGYHLNENFFAEASYTLSNHDNEVSFMNVVLGYNFHQSTFVTSDYTAKTSIFFVAGGGRTDFDGVAELNTIVGGAGYRVMLNDSFSLRFDLRGHIHHQVETDEEWAVDAEANAGLSYFF